MELKQIELITIDAGGTLLFPQPSVGAVYADVLRRHGKEACPDSLEKAFLRVWKKETARLVGKITAEGERERWRNVVMGTFEGIPGPLDLDAVFNDLWDEFASASRWRLPERASETIAALRSRGYRIALLSNWDDRLRPLLREMKLSHLFEEVFISCELGWEKPDPRVFTAVEDYFDLSGERIAHLGDSYFHDVQGALTAGWNPVQFQGDHPANAGHRRIENFPELLSLLPGIPAVQAASQKSDPDSYDGNAGHNEAPVVS